MFFDVNFLTRAYPIWACLACAAGRSLHNKCIVASSLHNKCIHHYIISALWQAYVILFTTGGRAQREAMATMSVLEHRPDLLKLALDLMAVLGSACGAALATALGAGGT